jgi:hypothetical protein
MVTRRSAPVVGHQARVVAPAGVAEVAGSKIVPGRPALVPRDSLGVRVQETEMLASRSASEIASADENGCGAIASVGKRQTEPLIRARLRETGLAGRVLEPGGP